MSLNFSRRVVRLARSLCRRPAPRPAAPRRFWPAVLCLEERALLSTLTVTNLNDSGDGSLRGALAQAQAGDTIAFDSGLQGTITLTSGGLRVTRGVTIQGPGADLLSISGNQASRVFEILPGAAATISGLTVTDGVANPAGSAMTMGIGGGIAVDPGAALTLNDSVVTGNVANAASASGNHAGIVAALGGGISCFGTLTLNGDLIQGNTANTGSSLGVVGARVSAAGGGIYNAAGTLTMTDTTVSDNTANAGASSFSTDAQGGGIYTAGPLSLFEVTVSGNTANAGSVAADRSAYVSGEGGGLCAVNGATLTVTNCFFLNNTATTASASAANRQSGLVDVRGEGGAIFNQDRLTVTTTAFSGNVANAGSATGGAVATVTGYGGAIDNHGGQLTATGLGVTDNVANAGSARSAARGLGGAIYGSGRITVDSSLVDGNTANSGSAFAIQADGGGIYDQSALVLTGSRVTGNTVNSGSAVVLTASGGGLWVAGGTVSDSSLSLNVVNSAAQIPLMYLSGGGIYATGRLAVTNSFVTFTNLNTNPTSGQRRGSSLTGGGLEAAGAAAFVTLNDSTLAANYALVGLSNIHRSAGGQVDPNSANNYIGMGGSGGLVSGVNGNVIV
jgi:hypothetical protein